MFDYKYKMVNGEEVLLTPEEIEELEQNDANELAKKIAWEKTEKYKSDREMLYDKRGATKDNLLIATWERVVENRPESSDALQAIRLQVKQEIPKPD